MLLALYLVLFLIIITIGVIVSKKIRGNGIMSWWKAIGIGFCIYLELLGLGLLAFVCLGLGYLFPNLANTTGYILYFPFGAKSFYHWFLDMFFWVLVIAVVIKFISKCLYTRKQKKTV